MLATLPAITTDLPRRWRQRELWIEDLHWHRRKSGFAPARFRWPPWEITDLALSATRLTEFTTPRHLSVLERGIASLSKHIHLLDYSVGRRLYEIHVAYNRCDCTTPVSHGDFIHEAWLDPLELVGFTRLPAAELIAKAELRPHLIDTHPRAYLVLKGNPLPNPLVEAWELRQMRAMYQHGVNALEDTFTDLVYELLDDGHDLEDLVDHTNELMARHLHERITCTRAERGGPGDPRRDRSQVFDRR